MIGFINPKATLLVGLPTKLLASQPSGVNALEEFTAIQSDLGTNEPANGVMRASISKLKRGAANICPLLGVSSPTAIGAHRKVNK